MQEITFKINLLLIYFIVVLKTHVAQNKHRLVSSLNVYILKRLLTNQWVIPETQTLQYLACTHPSTGSLCTYIHMYLCTYSAAKINHKFRKKSMTYDKICWQLLLSKKQCVKTNEKLTKICTKIYYLFCIVNIQGKQQFVCIGRAAIWTFADATEKVFERHEKKCKSSSHHTNRVSVGTVWHFHAKTLLSEKKTHFFPTRPITGLHIPAWTFTFFT
jgi:hypothetical protein